MNKVSLLFHIVRPIISFQYRKADFAITAGLIPYSRSQQAYIPLKMYGEGSKLLSYYAAGDQIMVDGFIKKSADSYEIIAHQISSYWLGEDLLQTGREQERLDKASQVNASFADVVCLLRPTDVHKFCPLERECEEDLEQEAFPEDWVILGTRQITKQDFQWALATVPEMDELIDLSFEEEKKKKTKRRPKIYKPPTRKDLTLRALQIGHFSKPQNLDQLLFQIYRFTQVYLKIVDRFDLRPYKSKNRRIYYTQDHFCDPNLRLTESRFDSVDEFEMLYDASDYQSFRVQFPEEFPIFNDIELFHDPLEDESKALVKWRRYSKQTPRLYRPMWYEMSQIVEYKLAHLNAFPIHMPQHLQIERTSLLAGKNEIDLAFAPAWIYYKFIGRLNLLLKAEPVYLKKLITDMKATIRRIAKRTIPVYRYIGLPPYAFIEFCTGTVLFHQRLLRTCILNVGMDFTYLVPLPPLTIKTFARARRMIGKGYEIFYEKVPDPVPSFAPIYADSSFFWFLDLRHHYLQLKDFMKIKQFHWSYYKHKIPAHLLKPKDFEQKVARGHVLIECNPPAEVMYYTPAPRSFAKVRTRILKNSVELIVYDEYNEQDIYVDIGFDAKYETLEKYAEYALDIFTQIYREPGYRPGELPIFYEKRRNRPHKIRRVIKPNMFSGSPYTHSLLPFWPKKTVYGRFCQYWNGL
nr:hypothetical protein [Cyanidioschyzonaceae sp. 3]WDB00443.1 ORF515 [Cyanidiococcus yangmingshanensis]